MKSNGDHSIKKMYRRIRFDGHKFEITMSTKIRSSQLKPIKTVMKLITKELEGNNRLSMNAFKILKGKCSDDIERINIRIKNDELFWIHLGSFEKTINELGFRLSWMSRDGLKTQFNLMLVRNRSKN